MSRLWLIGMMGTGKTSAGRLAAARLQVEFHDTDEVVESRLGCSIPRFWGSRGEAAFREIEAAVIAGLQGADGITAAGGGAVLRVDNREIIGSTGHVIWLGATPTTIKDRLAGSRDRPMLGEGAVDPEAIAVILREREPSYAALADVKVDTDQMTVEEVAEVVTGLWPG